MYRDNGIVERDEHDAEGIATKRGTIRPGVVPNSTKNTLEPIVLGNVEPETTISTDEHVSYRDLGRVYEHWNGRTRCEGIRSRHSSREHARRPLVAA
jgi:hypothetical protein